MMEGFVMLSEILRESKDRSINRRPKDIWKGTIYSFLSDYTSDQIGNWGEDLFQALCRSYNFPVTWDGNCNIKPEDGIYDMLVNWLKWRTEIKTARKGTTSDTWQHDVIKESSVYDKLVLQDLTVENGCYITIIDSSDMVYGTKHPIFKKKSTPCKNGWKFDMSNASLKRGLDAGLTYYANYNDGKQNDGLEEFLRKHFNN